MSPGRRRARPLLVAGAGALAAASLACRRPEAPSAGCLRLRAPEGPVGFGAPLSISATLACAGLEGGRVTWRQVDGPTLDGVAAAPDGRLFTARMPALAAVLEGPIPWGVVPLSPRTRGQVTLEAAWSDGHGRELRERVRVTAASRSRGLPNTPVGARVYLGGSGWRLAARPAGSHAALETAGGASSLLPDVAGDWRLVDGDARALALRTGRYDDTPLDCGRAGCHAAIADATAGSPMTTILAREAGQASGPAGDHDGHDDSHGPGDAAGAGAGASAGAAPECAIACHATGEPGIPDGGFSHVALELGAEHDAASVRWDALPRALRRLGGVGCLACHGPGALPAESARWSVLRADVCAVCHDAPPRYGHVAAWRASALARADRDVRARSERGCARCHTTWGFLAAVESGGAPAPAAAPARPVVDRRPPDGVGPVGITCAACHAVHAPAHVGAPPPAPALLRAPPAPALLADALDRLPDAGRARVCLPCHTPDADARGPASSAAALWLGRGGLDPASGRPLLGDAPHAAVAGGCVGCHREGPPGVALARGGSHGFRAARAACGPCHAQQPPPSDVRERARRLWDAWTGRGADARPDTGATRPPHAGGARIDRRTPLGRAAWDLLLVLEDPAADAHNARYARALLAAAEPIIAAATAAHAGQGGTRP